MENKDKKVLGDIMGGLTESFDNETRESELYKNLAKHKDLQSLLRHADDEMSLYALTLYQVMQEVHGMKSSNQKYRTVQALPAAIAELTAKITKEEGTTCSTDKAFQRVAMILEYDNQPK